MHLRAVLTENRAEFFGTQGCANMLDELRETDSDLVDAVTGKPLSMSIVEVTDVFRRLLEDGLPAGDPRAVLEALARFRAEKRDPFELHRHMRSQLRRLVSQQAAEGLVIHAVGLTPDLEAALAEVFNVRADGTVVFAMTVDERNRTVAAVRDAVRASKRQLSRPVVVVGQSGVRAGLKRLLATEIPAIQVLTTDEVAPGYALQVEPVRAGTESDVPS